MMDIMKHRLVFVCGGLILFLLCAFFMLEGDSLEDDNRAQAKPTAPVEITEYTVTIKPGGDRKLPLLPSSLQELKIERTGSDGNDEYSFAGLTDLKNLQTLRIAVWGEFDAELLKNMHSLRQLEFIGVALKHADALSSLSGLEELSFSFCDQLSDISFVRGMSSLKILRGQFCPVSDLSPVDTLSFLQELDATNSSVVKLPAGPLPSLKDLKILGTRVSSESVKDFERSHPDCRIWYSWNESLHRALQGVTEVRARMGMFEGNPNPGANLFEEKDRDSVEDLIAHLIVDDSKSEPFCSYDEGPKFDFYKDGQVVVTLGLLHGKNIRWDGVWPGDALLTPESMTFFTNWLARHGYTTHDIVGE